MFSFVPAGPPDPNKSVFVRHSSTVVCTAGIAHSLAIEPRDEFNNLCLFHPDENPTDGYNVAITQVTVHRKWVTHLLPSICLHASPERSIPCCFKAEVCN